MLAASAKSEGHHEPHQHSLVRAIDDDVLLLRVIDEDEDGALAGGGKRLWVRGDRIRLELHVERRRHRGSVENADDVRADAPLLKHGDVLIVTAHADIVRDTRMGVNHHRASPMKVAPLRGHDVRDDRNVDAFPADMADIRVPSEIAPPVTKREKVREGTDTLAT